MRVRIHPAAEYAPAGEHQGHKAKSKPMILATAINAANSRKGSANSKNSGHFATFIGVSLVGRCWPQGPDRLKFGLEA